MSVSSGHRSRFADDVPRGAAGRSAPAGASSFTPPGTAASSGRPAGLLGRLPSGLVGRAARALGAVVRPRYAQLPWWGRLLAPIAALWLVFKLVGALASLLFVAIAAWIAWRIWTLWRRGERRTAGRLLALNLVLLGIGWLLGAW